MSSPNRGEVWLVDLGYTAKVRPCLVISIPALVQDRALATLIPHTTSSRGSRFEVVVAQQNHPHIRRNASGINWIIPGHWEWLLPNAQHYTVGCFKSRTEAENQKRFLGKWMPAAEFEVVFDSEAVASLRASAEAVT